MNASEQARLVTALGAPSRYDHPVTEVRRIETHISYVLLTGAFAYKIKKAVNLGFADFSTLQLRREYCLQELRLNRRLAPDLYIDVVAIFGSPEHPTWKSSGAAIEYAVKMREFDQEAMLDQMLARGEMNARHIDILAAEISSFHASIEIAAPDSAFGRPENVLHPVEDNFSAIAAELDDPQDRERLEALKGHAEREYQTLVNALADRKARGLVRECHGDMHLGNMVFRDGQVMIFDCIEFNDSLRWIDVLSEVAFLVMDLQDRGRADLAFRALNRYLEVTGDYGGIVVLRFYLGYRAMVRAKVACIRGQQPDCSGVQRAAAANAFRAYLGLASSYALPGRPAILINHGVSGSGKTTFSQSILEAIGAVRVRSDTERKRLHAMLPGARSASAVAAGIYDEEAGRRTYDRLSELARVIACAGYPVIVDAAFLDRRQRDRFRALALELRVPFLILHYRSSIATCRRRLATRQAQGLDASEADDAVLDFQLATSDALGPDEAGRVFTIDAERRAADTRERWTRLESMLYSCLLS